MMKTKIKKKLYGHPDFYKITQEENELHSKKNRDYATSKDPMRNFRSVARMSKGLITPGNEDVKVAIIYMLKQLDAAMNLLAENREGKVEGVRERLRDIAVYAKLAMILYKEGVMKK